ncbi:hypothetical protein ACS8E3_00320 [Psychrobacter sp. 2Y5]|uniref:hypothetical protein n=1 Tax=unclassified Psychrobacter TaxID=196806 RepID=UPI003F462558
MTKKNKLDVNQLDEYTYAKIKPWQRIIDNKNGNKIFIANAKVCIGNILASKGHEDQALQSWRSVRKEENEKIYEIAQFYIGELLIKSDDIKDVEEARKCLSNVKNKFSYEVRNKLVICDLLLNEHTKCISKRFLKISKNISEILSLLKININSVGKSQFYAERKLAHYTSTDVGNFLLMKRNTSLFRLNTINNVNDPSEGQLLECYLNDSNKKTFDQSEFHEKYQAFIGCFTFNHDSLNQFRLYGKKDNKEASGISLVFNKGFFKESDHPDELSFIAPKNDLKQSQENIRSEAKIVDNEPRTIRSQPVMRCVYIDPESGFLYLAQRNKITFYREYANIAHKEESKTNIVREWKSYQKYISKKTSEFERLFEGLKNNYQEVIADINHLDGSYRSKVNNLLDSILLPLKYLIKHSAFQEEQECRIIYITALDNPEVQMDFGSFLYVDYEPVVKFNLDKIYIAPAANQYQPYLAKLLCDTDVKIELSNNPYRQT